MVWYMGVTDQSNLCILCMFGQKQNSKKSQQRKKRKTAKGNGSGMSNRCQRNHGDRLLTSSICLCLGNFIAQRPSPSPFPYLSLSICFSSMNSENLSRNSLDYGMPSAIGNVGANPSWMPHCRDVTIYQLSYIDLH